LDNCLEDLWKELEIASKKPIREVMASWTEQKGFPVVSVSRQSVSSEQTTKQY